MTLSVREISITPVNNNQQNNQTRADVKTDLLGCSYEFAYQPKTYAKMSGATIDASDSMMNFGVSIASLPHVIFSFGTAPEYEPKLVVESLICSENVPQRSLRRLEQL